ncbi:MAG TPA: flagellar biosynthesis anti-sigma factor FlgM [Sphingomicrobium sp.]|jgi:negative regulator of flagellin synthesis FlgM|nr:flagellar biosynthesis anti-sigma factor FlgM [Sphingomicrobium sp.]
MVDPPAIPPLRGVSVSQRPQAQPATRSAHPEPAGLTEKSLPQLVSLASELSDGPPPIDYPAIARIRAAISDGSYRIDAEAIARALLGKPR